MIYVHMVHAFPHSNLTGQGTYPQNHGATLPLILPSEVVHKYQISWKKTTSLGAASIMLLLYLGVVLLNMLLHPDLGEEGTVKLMVSSSGTTRQGTR